MIIQNNILKYILKNTYFINGTAYAGKSTMVKLLAEKYNGILCKENYHDELMGAIDAINQPNLSYFQTMSGWQEYINRSPEEYDAWIIGTSKEAAELEIIKLIQLSLQNKKIFVDTNIPIELLKEIADYHHVAFMLAPQIMSVEKFFDREDPEKQFLYRKIQESANPAKTLVNFKACLAKLNSQEHYDEFVQSGYFTYIRTEQSTIAQALSVIEQHFGLSQGDGGVGTI